MALSSQTVIIVDAYDLVPLSSLTIPLNYSATTTASHSVVTDDGADTNTATEPSSLATSFLESVLLRDVFHATRFDDTVSTTVLIRPYDTLAGLVAYSLSSSSSSSSAAAAAETQLQLPPANRRATRLAMACGLFSMRFRGKIVLGRLNNSNNSGKEGSLSIEDVAAACTISPDLRRENIVEHLLLQIIRDCSSDQDEANLLSIPLWLSEAAKNNYHDQEVLARLAEAMKEDRVGCSNEDDDGTSSESSSGKENTEEAVDQQTSHTSNDDDELETTPQPRLFVAKSPLCLQCRRPADTLCTNCQGAYFCDDDVCKTNRWSHDCICSTWRLYVERRTTLSTFSLGSWHRALMGRDCQLSEEPYRLFLEKHLGSTMDQTTWWRTELHGWNGGDSDSAQSIDVTIRRSFEEGFAPICEIPPERHNNAHNRSNPELSRNELGLIQLHSWDAYYRLRDVADTSIAALLLTFPLTLYYAIIEYGQVPCTVARMLNRPLRVHVVGAEKEINFLDLFKEVSFLLPEDFALELVFVVRRDMLPPSLRGPRGDCQYSVTLTETMTVRVVSGSYGDSLNPLFDCGSGSPDMVMAFNAGLYAYESWRSVIRFLNENKGVLGVFTDYNEMSAVQCASLGGSESRESVKMNPFRQPRAMPVYSMNLPQFSNGFLYTCNQQELD